MLDDLRRHWGAVGFLLLLAWFWQASGTAATGAILFASLIHEGGHLAALKLLGVSGNAVGCSPFGIVIYGQDIRLTYPQELLAVLAGPAVNLICGAILGSLSRVCPGAGAAAGAQWVLGIFNLLPAAPLDGWRCLQLLLCWVAGPTAGERAANVAGSVGAVLLSGGIVLLMIFTGGNLWLLPPAAGLALNAWRSVGK